MDAPAITKRAHARGRGIELSQRRQVTCAHHDFALGLERHEDAPGGNATHEIARAIDRVDNPAAAAAGFARRTLLAQDPVLGKRLLEQARDQLLVGAVRGGHR